MTGNYHYTKSDTAESLIVSGQVVRTIASSHPNFEKVRDYCFAQDSKAKAAGIPIHIDFDHVLSLIDAGANVVKSLLRVTDRVAYKDGKLLWDGEEVENALSAHIVRMIKAGDDNYLAFAKFMENLATNPSKASRKSLFDWIADRDFTITADGHFIGYKGVNSDLTSCHSGYGIVDGVEMTANLPNEIGSTVEVPRSKVDEDRESACSFGLHIGTRGYATSYGSRMIIVAVNPRDVVMVPRDGGGEKMRVCKYVVLDDNEAQLEETTYTGGHRAEEAEVDHCVECGDELPEDGCPCGDPDECADCLCPLEEDGSCVCCDDKADVEEDNDNGECEYCGATLDSDGVCPEDED